MHAVLEFSATQCPLLAEAVEKLLIVSLLKL
jgi:hypothetical protein